MLSDGSAETWFEYNPLNQGLPVSQLPTCLSELADLHLLLPALEGARAIVLPDLQPVPAMLYLK